MARKQNGRLEAPRLYSGQAGATKSGDSAPCSCRSVELRHNFGLVDHASMVLGGRARVKRESLWTFFRRLCARGSSLDDAQQFDWKVPACMAVKSSRTLGFRANYIIPPTIMSSARLGEGCASRMMDMAEGVAGTTRQESKLKFGNASTFSPGLAQRSPVFGSLRV